MSGFLHGSDSAVETPSYPHVESGSGRLRAGSDCPCAGASPSGILEGRPRRGGSYAPSFHERLESLAHAGFQPVKDKMKNAFRYDVRVTQGSSKGN